MREKIPYQEAYDQAVEVVELMRPFCERIEIAGSLRRKQPFVNDIEIVAIPKPYEYGLFEDGLAMVVNDHYPKLKGEMIYGKCKYSQRCIPESLIKLDLFFPKHDNWGLILAIRTGSAEYSHKVLASKWASMGFKSENGYLHNEAGEKLLIYEEKQLFDLLGLPFTEPELRNI